MTDLNDYVDPASGWLFTNATGINDTGDIVGVGLIGGEIHGYALIAGTLPAQAPVAAPVANRIKGRAPLTVSFTGQDSYDPDGAIVAYAWSFGDGSYSTEMNPTHVYGAKGRYTAKLEVTDVEGLTDAVDLTIRALRPKR